MLCDMLFHTTGELEIGNKLNGLVRSPWLVVAQVLQNATHFAFFKRKLTEPRLGLVQLAKTEVSEQL
jgi:hypothetical protein